MYEIRETKHYRDWLKGLKDRHTRIRIGIRIERLEHGNFGEHKDFGDISELRIDYGPGYRVYYMHRGQEIIILLVGGSKRTQKRDIEVAREIARNLREGRNDGRY